MPDPTPPAEKRERLTMAYADPPYPGQSKIHYADHPDYAGEVDSAGLIGDLVRDFPDGWALSTDQGSLRHLLPLCPEEGVRVLVWVKPFASIKKGVDPTYAWEPVIMCGGRNRFGRGRMVRDWVAAMPPAFRGDRAGAKGKKPLEFCHWLFDCLGLEDGDEFHDLFPGSGAVSEAWGRWRSSPTLAFVDTPSADSLFDGEAA